MLCAEVYSLWCREKLEKLNFVFIHIACCYFIADTIFRPKFTTFQSKSSLFQLYIKHCSSKRNVVYWRQIAKLWFYECPSHEGDQNLSSPIWGTKNEWSEWSGADSDLQLDPVVDSSCLAEDVEEDNSVHSLTVSTLAPAPAAQCTSICISQTAPQLGLWQHWHLKSIKTSWC